MNGYLLDTHVALWWLQEPAMIREGAIEAIRDSGEPLWTSVAALWEMAIKRALKRLTYPADIVHLLELDSIDILLLTPSHALAVADLPLLHGDPFDRVQVVQARAEGLTLVTRDEQLAAYGVPILRA